MIYLKTAGSKNRRTALHRDKRLDACFLQSFRPGRNPQPPKLFPPFVLYKMRRVRTKARSIILDEKGAVIVEYILLLAVSAVIARALINALTEWPGGAFIKWWRQLLRNIAADISSS